MFFSLKSEFEAKSDCLKTIMKLAKRNCDQKNLNLIHQSFLHFNAKKKMPISMKYVRIPRKKKPTQLKKNVQMLLRTNARVFCSMNPEKRKYSVHRHKLKTIHLNNFSNLNQVIFVPNVQRVFFTCCNTVNIAYVVVVFFFFFFVCSLRHVLCNCEIKKI